MSRRSSCMLAVLLFVCALAGCGEQGGITTRIPQLPSTQGHTVDRRDVLATASTDIAIDAGGAASGKWAADNGYNLGHVVTTKSSINTSKVTNPAPMAVYQSQRAGSSFSYVVSELHAGASYTVRLHMVESTWKAAGKRKFNVTINGTSVLNDFDIYAKAGGENIAIVEQFPAKADKNGIITIIFSATVNDATVAGVEIESGASNATPAPPSGYPLYSSLFTGNTPFHHTVAALMSAGAVVASTEVARHYWAQGVGTLQPFNPSVGLGPLYVVQSGDPGYVFSCPAYGTCGASGKVVHYPDGAAASTGSDHHLVSIDAVYAGGETDGWGGYGPSNQRCNLSDGSPDGRVTCSWGGFFPFSGNGLANPAGSSGIAGGYALGLVTIGAQELLNGHIDHALGIVQSCLDNGGIYPSTIGRTSDALCPSNLEPNAVYGSMIHLKSGVDINALSSNSYCRTILTAFQTYGAYTTDTSGSYGIDLLLEWPTNPLYTAANPWTTKIFPSLVATGDASGTADGGPLYFKSCLQNVQTSDIEVISISPNLPPQ